MGLLDSDVSLNLASRSSLQRRIFISAAVFSLVACLFLVRQSAFPRPQDSFAPEQISDPAAPETTTESTWKPPEDWDPTNLIHDSFER